jgi:dipeptidyl aminopeptidase/acylaminoacyl peptidase
MLCLNSSANATIECLRFLKPISEWKKINIPVLIIHGDADETVPITISATKQQHSFQMQNTLHIMMLRTVLFITEKKN